MTTTTRRMRSGIVSTTLALAAVVAVPLPAVAYTMQGNAACSGPGTRWGHCGIPRWMVGTTSPNHAPNTIRAGVVKVLTTSAAVPAVRFSSSCTSSIADCRSPTAAKLGPKTSCRYSEAHITFRDPGIRSWNFGTPEDVGEDYYAARIDDDSYLAGRTASPRWTSTPRTSRSGWSSPAQPATRSHSA